MSKIEIRTADGVCPAYELGTGPSVLLFMDGIGMRQVLVDMAERVAAAGYHVLMPDLFYRAGAYTAPDPKKLFSDEAVRKEHWAKFMAVSSVAGSMRDTEAFLAKLPGKVVVTGYCMGGRLALSAAGTFPDRIAGAAAFHPGGLATDAPDSPHLLADKIKAKVYVAAASEDQSFPAEQIAKLEQALTAAHVDHTIETYPCKHGWTMSDTPVYDAAGTQRHDKALFDLCKSVL